MMKLSSAIEGGIAGATTLGLITETLHNINRNSPHVNLLQQGKLKKRFKKSKSNNGFKATRNYIQLAGDLLSSTAYFGLSALVKKKNIVLKGGLLGAAAGLGSIFLDPPIDEKLNGKKRGTFDPDKQSQFEDSLDTQIAQVALFTIGGMLAGKIVESLEPNKKSRKKKNK